MDKWIIYNKATGEIFDTEDYSLATQCYESFKKDLDYIESQSDILLPEDRIILAKVEKDFKSSFSYLSENDSEVWKFSESK